MSASAVHLRTDRRYPCALTEGERRPWARTRRRSRQRPGSSGVRRGHPRGRCPRISASWAPASLASRPRLRRLASAAMSPSSTRCLRSAGNPSTRSSAHSAGCSPTARTATSSPMASPTTSCASSARKARCITAAGAHRTRRWLCTTRVEEAVRKAEVTVLLGAILRAVTRDGARVRALDLSTRYGDVRLSAAGFVDATGDAALTFEAGFPCREHADGPIYGTQMMVLEGIDEARQPGRAELTARARAKAADYGLVRTDGFAFVFPGRATALVNLTHVETPLDPIAASRNALTGKAQADRVLHFLRREYPEAFGEARVRSYGLPGIRQTRWIAGRAQLTLDDVRAGTRFADAIARTAWPIELHDRAEGYVWEPFSDDHVHYVPFGSLVPAEAANIVAAGRCIDGDSAALSSVRVMGPCIAMGAAAAHALDLAGSGSVAQIDMAALRRRVRDNVERVD